MAATGRIEVTIDPSARARRTLRDFENTMKRLDAILNPRPLTFQSLAAANFSRANRWHHGDFPHDNEWTGADWSNAMCGEAGEAANVVKKLRRHETGLQGALDPDHDELVDKLAHELADTVIYADLLAQKYGIDLGAAVAEKFNIVSERQGLPERLRETARA